MNSATKDEFVDFITAVEGLAVAVSVIAGQQVVADLINEAESLKTRLQSDETITEIK